MDPGVQEVHKGCWSPLLPVLCFPFDPRVQHRPVLFWEFRLKRRLHQFRCKSLLPPLFFFLETQSFCCFIRLWQRIVQGASLLGVLIYIFALKKAHSLAAGWYRLHGFGQKAAANGSCSQMLRGGNLCPCCSLFVAQIVPKCSPKIWTPFLKQGGSDCCQAFKRLSRKTRRQKLNVHQKEKRSFGPACKDTASLLASLK